MSKSNGLYSMNTLRKTCLIFALLFASFSLHAQNPQGVYGNEWYVGDPGRTFIPIKVWEDGVYRVSASDLSAAGYDLSMVNPDFLQLFYRGGEQAIYVQQSNGSLAYIEFLGQRNDGQIDALMYRDPISAQPDPSQQPEPRLSIFSDTAVYYLTWSNQAGQRVTTYFDTNYSNYAPESNFPFEQVIRVSPDSTDYNYINGGAGQFDVFYNLNSDYVTGEGYVGPSFNYQQALQIQLPLVAPDTQIQTIDYRTRIARSQTPHSYRISDGDGVLWDTIHNQSGVFVDEYHFSRTHQLPAVLDLTFEALRVPVDNNQFCGLSVFYDRLPTLVGERSTQIANWDHNGIARFDLEQLDGNDTIYAWDLQ